MSNMVNTKRGRRAPTDKNQRHVNEAGPSFHKETSRMRHGSNGEDRVPKIVFASYGGGKGAVETLAMERSYFV